MLRKMPHRSWMMPGLVTLCGGLSAVGIGLAGERCCRSTILSEFTGAARQAVTCPLEAQAANGSIVDRTIWNHHFIEGTAELHPGGIAQLNRLARQYAFTPGLQLFLQTTHDVTFRGDLPAYVTTRNELDTKRLAAISAYLTQVTRRHDVALAIHDPRPVGMSAMEARLTVGAMQRTGKGQLPAEITSSQGISGLVGGGGGGGGGSFSPPPSAAEMPMEPMLPTAGGLLDGQSGAPSSAGAPSGAGGPP